MGKKAGPKIRFVSLYNGVKMFCMHYKVCRLNGMTRKESYKASKGFFKLALVWSGARFV